VYSKVLLSPWYPWRHMSGGGINPLIRNLGRTCSEWSDSCLSRFILGETDTSNPSVGVWIGPQIRSGGFEEERILFSCPWWEWKHYFSTISALSELSRLHRSTMRSLPESIKFQ
jgi:hypothetical protein